MFGTFISPRHSTPLYLFANVWPFVIFPEYSSWFIARIISFRDVKNEIEPFIIFIKERSHTRPPSLSSSGTSQLHIAIPWRSLTQLVFTWGFYRWLADIQRLYDRGVFDTMYTREPVIEPTRGGDGGSRPEDVN